MLVVDGPDEDVTIEAVLNAQKEWAYLFPNEKYRKTNGPHRLVKFQKLISQNCYSATGWYVLVTA